MRLARGGIVSIHGNTETCRAAHRLIPCALDHDTSGVYGAFCTFGIRTDDARGETTSEF